MSNDLSNQLRSLNTFEWMARPAATKQICFDAADRIEKLERDILNYSSAVADAQMRNEELDRAINRIIDRWEAQKARIEKLEAALREIAYTEPEDKYWPGRIARKALEGKE